MTYTIDLTQNFDCWRWRLYKQGGSVFVQDGEASSIEAAVDDAKRAMLVHHRADQARRALIEESLRRDLPTTD